MNTILLNLKDMGTDFSRKQNVARNKNLITTLTFLHDWCKQNHISEVKRMLDIAKLGYAIPYTPTRAAIVFFYIRRISRLINYTFSSGNYYDNNQRGRIELQNYN